MAVTGGVTDGTDPGNIFVGINDDITAGTVPSIIALDPDGLMGGVQLGYNAQMPGLPWLLGFEADISTSDISSTQTIIAISGATTITTAGSNELDWLTTFRARLGFAATDQLLLYATGGRAGGHASSSISVASVNGPGCFGCSLPYSMSGSKSATLWGWAAGAGFEYAINPRWSFKSEFLFYDLGTIRTGGVDPNFDTGDFPPPPLPFIVGTTPVHGGIIRAGLNYNFNLF
jgi:outer membrane immunogenic protein